MKRKFENLQPDEKIFVRAFVGIVKIVSVATIFAIFFGVSAFLNSFVTNESIEREIEAQGFSGIEIVYRSNVFAWLQGCTGSDGIKIDFVADNPNKQRVELIACRGGIEPWAKGLSIRSKN